MNRATFFDEIKRRATRKCVAPDPLAESRRILKVGGLTAEGQMLRKLVSALASGEGEFGDADVHRLGADALALAAALIDARLVRRYSDTDWTDAAATITA